MKPNLLDKLSKISNQSFDLAVISDRDGKPVGKIYIRYVKAMIGSNSETGIIFHYKNTSINLERTIKNDSANHEAVYVLLSDAGAKVYNHSGTKYHNLIGVLDRSEIDVSSISRPSDYSFFKIANNKFNILWV